MNTAILSVATLLCAALPAQTVTHYWVDAVNGNDANPGTRAQPFQSLAAAVGLQVVDVHIHVLPGVYSPSTTGDFQDPVMLTPNSISLSGYQNLKLTGSDRDACVLDFAGGDGPWGFLKITGGSVGVEVSDLTMVNAGVDPWGNGAISVDGGVQDVDIHNCYFGQTYSTLIVWSGFDVSFHDNVVVDSVPNAGTWPSVGVRIRTNGSTGDRTYIYNNTFYAVDQGISWGNDANNPQQWIVNNVVLDAAAKAFPNTTYPGPHVVFENNQAFGSGVSDYDPVIGPGGTSPVLSSTNRAVDPLLVNPAAGDFSLANGSPCIDTGYALSLPNRMNDFLGNNRATDSDEDGSAIPDRGAIETTDLSLQVSNFELGMQATIDLSTPNPGAWAIGGLFMSLGTDLLYIPSVGMSGLDLAASASAIAIPGAPFLFTIPANPVLSETWVHMQALGLKSVGGQLVLKPTGLSSHLL